MNQPTSDGGSEQGGMHWSEGQAIELWKYFGGVGAADKNTMVTVESLLLGFSAAIVGYVGTNLLCFRLFGIADPYRAICIALLGIVISCVAGYVSLLYGGYSNRNWAQADAIARNRAARYPKWAELLLRENSKPSVEEGTTGKPSWFAATAWRFGRSCDPLTQLAPIFCLYAWLALSAGLFHLWVLFVSVRALSS
jgi:hypothetical protein